MITPLLLSLRVAILATGLALIVGVAVAALLARRRGALASLADSLVSLPLVLPPTVLGYYLLVTFGARSPIGAFLDQIGLPLVFTWRGAVVAAAVVAIPLVIQSSKAALEAVDLSLADVARTLGRSEISIFFTISLPLAARGILAGTMLAFARALGEFGATLLVASNIPGRTQTLPIAIYDAVQVGDQARANALALLLTVTAVALLFGMRRLGSSLPAGQGGG
ncbi:MAG TPA: molybdate ABC transporter permease subunit [Anaerolineales bacterium]|nr:molybdate ABC transporter permease subunit [Anaerolineales bacterium]